MKSPTNPKRTLIESLQVGLARDSQIKEWAERELPNGEVVGRVKNAQTVNYKTLKPVKDGLFCEKIFGPIKDFECACGFKQTRGGFCPQCNVEFTRSEVRRYRLGYFQLPSAVAHVWYLRGRPSYISYLLGIKIKKALALTYGAASLLVNSNNEKVIFQKENETLPFSFTTQTLYSVGECKGKAIPRSGTRRYNPNYFLFDRERAKLIQNLFQNFLYSYRSKRNQNSHLLPKFILAQKANLEDFSNKKKENLRNSLLDAKIDFSKKEQGFISHADTTPVSSASHKGATHPNSYLTRGFFFSSTIRSGWHPLIVVNLQDKLPVKFLYKKENPRYYKFKKYLKFSKNIGFCTPPIFNVDNDDDVFAVNLFNEAKKKKQRKNENLSGVKINHPNEKFNTINSHFGDFVSQNGISSNGCSTVYKVKCEDNKKRTKSFLKKLVFKNTKNRIKKSLIGVDKNKEVGVATLLFYPIKKEINKLQEKKYLLKNSSELTKKIYQELASKFTSLNSVENTINQVDFSAISEKERDLQSEYFENNQSAKPMDEFSRKSVEEIDGSTVKGSEKSQSFALKKKELEDFRSIFHFIGQPCQLRKKSRFLIHTACNFSQTRNEIFKILKKAKSINSVQFGDQLPCYDENLKEKYRILNNNIKKKYQQNHLFPFLFCLSCQSRNYQYLQTYSNFFLPTPPDSEKTLLISSYKHQIRKEQSLNLYDSFIRDNFVISTLFSCFNNCSTVDLRNLVNTLSMSPSVDFLVEKKEIKNLENLVEQDQFPVQRTQNVNNNQSFEKEGNNGISPLNMESTIFENGLQSKFTSKNDLQLQNTNNIQNLTTTLSTEDNGQVNHILGEIPLVLTSCRNIAWRSLSLGGGTTKMAAQPLDATTKFLQSKSLNSRPKSLKRRREKNLKFFQQENQTVSFLELKQNSPLLQDKDLNLFVRKNVESQLNQNQFDVFDVDLFSFSKNKEMKKKPLSSASQRGATHSNILQNKNLVLSKSGKQYSRFQKVDLFERFGRQNFYFGWKTRKQIKKILKIDKILGNLKKSIRPPIPSASWSYLFKKSNKEDYLFSIYEISVQQALGYTCGEAILKLLSPIDCDQLESGLKVVLWQINERISEVENQGFLLKSDIILLNSLRTKKSRTLRRLKIAKILRKTKVLPKQMVFSLLPVLPPSLRPIIQLDENIVAVSDCSQIYQKIVQRSNRLSKRMSKYLSYDHCLRLKVLLQQAVDGLIENGKGGSKPLCDNNGRPLKSLSDGLKGKKGRFRQDLLGRRVDYSGRSVIVVGPALKLHQCGLPKEMAIELFQPFLIRQLFAKKIVSNIAVAKNYIKKETPIVLEILKQLLKSHPVLLNRAPTLHRLGVQAFQPKLVSGRAILLHPLVCSAFNADFDGDQMAVHIPLSSKARGEAWKILWSRNNILSPATGQPILVPSQDMVLGCYYLTTKKANLLIKRANVLQNKMLSTKREDGTSWSQNVKSSTVNILQGKIFYSNKPFLFGPDVLGSSLPQSGKVESTQNKERNSESQFPQSQSDKETEPTTTFPKDKYKNQLSTGKTLSESIVLHSYITHKNGEDVNGFNGSQKTVISNDPHNRDFEDQNFVKQNLVEQNRTGKDRNGLKNLSPEKKKGPNNLVKQDIFYFDKEQPHTKIWFSPGETITKKYNLTTGSFFNSSDQVLKGLQQKRLKLHTSIWLKMEHDIEIQKEEQKPLEARINCCGNFTKIYPGYLRRFYKKEGLFFNNTNIKKPEDFYVRTTCGRVMLNQTISPISHQPF